MKNTASERRRKTNGSNRLELHLYRYHFRRLHRHCHLVPCRIHQGVLHRKWRGIPLCQRHGHGSRLDVCGHLYLHGWWYCRRWLWCIKISHGLDRGVCPAHHPDGSLFKEIWESHRARFYRRPLLFQRGPAGGGNLCNFYLHDLYYGTDARGWHRIFTPI